MSLSTNAENCINIVNRPIAPQSRYLSNSLFLKGKHREIFYIHFVVLMGIVIHSVLAVVIIWTVHDITCVNTSFKAHNAQRVKDSHFSKIMFPCTSYLGGSKT